MSLKSRYHPLWRSTIRPFILYLDGYCCRVCGTYSFHNDVHHNTDERHLCNVSQLFTLCPHHHRLVDTGKFTLGARDLTVQNMSYSAIINFQSLVNTYKPK